MAGAVEYTGLGAAEVAGRVKKEWESRAQALGMPLGTAVVDPSAPDLIHQMSKLGLSVMAGRNDLDEGIATVDRALRSGDILLPEQEARPLLAAMSEYTWDEKAQERGEDKPVGRVAHLPDATAVLVLPPQAPTGRSQASGVLQHDRIGRDDADRMHGCMVCSHWNLISHRAAVRHSDAGQLR